MFDKNDIIGKKYNKLTVLEYSHTKKYPKGTIIYYKVQCDCDNKTIKYVSRANILSGGTKSCGCLGKELVSIRTKERNYTHGLSKTSEYKIWFQMKERCYNNKHVHYADYGGRGILICNDWILNFINFYNDMGPRPSVEYSIDRIDNNKGYSKDNCRWVTRNIQVRNQRVRNNTTGYTGIVKTYNNKFRVNLNYKNINGIKRSIWFGTQDTLLSAIAVRQQAEIQYWNDVYTKYPIRIYQ